MSLNKITNLALNLFFRLFLINSILSCGYFKIEIKKNNLSLLSTNELIIDRNGLSNPLFVTEGSTLNLILLLKKPLNSDEQFQVFLENSIGISSSTMFNLNQNIVTFPAGATSISISINSRDDNTYYETSQWVLRFESLNLQIPTNDILEFTLVDNDNIPPTFGKIKTNFSTVALSTETVSTSKLLDDGKILVAGYSNASGSNDFTLIKYNSNGTVDTSFGNEGRVTTDINLGSNDQPLDIGIQSDGKIILVGLSNPNGNNDLTLVRYSQNGNIDTTFGVNGKVFTDIKGGSNDIAHGVYIQNNGKILVGGYTNSNGSNDFLIVRYNSNGTIDTKFGLNGKVITNISGNDFAYNMKIQKDGKIILAGSALGSNYDFCLVRYSPDGELDLNFGSNGIVLTDIGANSVDYGISIEIKNDGKILFLGSSILNPSTNSEITLVQYTSSGEIDNSFGTNGKTIVGTLPGSSDIPTNFKIKTDNSILVSGYTNSFNGDFVIMEFTSNGLLNKTFGLEGKVILDLGSSTKDTLNNIEILTDGTIFLVGSSDLSGSLDFVIAKLLSSGELDKNFGLNGKITTDIGTGSSDILSDIKQLKNGKIILTGYTNSNLNGDFDFAITKLNENGTTDIEFGALGKVTTDINFGSSDYVTGTEIQSDGKIVLYGYSTYTNNSHISIVRYMPNGNLDSTFGDKGIVTIKVNAQSSDQGNSLKILNDGKLLIAGSSRSELNSDFFIARLTNSGNLDTTFGNNGMITTDIGTLSWDEAFSLQVQSDGKILLGGYSNSSGNPDFTITRYNSNGTIDSSFGKSGKVITNLGGNDYAYTMSLVNDDKILLCGSTDTIGSNDFAVVRYTNSGSIDSSFANNGLARIDIGFSSNDSIDSVVVLDDDNILLSGYSNSKGKFDPTIIKLSPNGKLDTSFGINGKVSININSNYITNRNPIQIQNNGDILFGSTAKELEFTSFDFFLTRLNKHGQEN